MSEGKKIIYEEGPYTIAWEPEQPEGLVELLESIRWGTKKTLYKHFYVREILSMTPRPHYFTLRENGGPVMGTVVFCERRVRAGGKEYKGFYIRFFAVSPSLRGQGLTHKVSYKVMDWIREREQEPTLLLAGVEKNNAVSYRITTTMGFEPCFQMRTLGFSRFFPRRRVPVRALADEGEWAAFFRKLQEFHAHKNFVVWDSIRVGPPYMVWEENGEVVLGAKPHMAYWQIENMPGLVGAFLKIAPYLPLVGKVFDVKNFKFVTLEGLFVKQGYEHRIPEFLESVVAYFGLNRAMVMLDEKDAIYQFLRERQDMGILNRFTGDASGTIMLSPHRIPEEELPGLTGAPGYVAAMDYI